MNPVCSDGSADSTEIWIATYPRHIREEIGRHLSGLVKLPTWAARNTNQHSIKFLNRKDSKNKKNKPRLQIITYMQTRFPHPVMVTYINRFCRTVKQRGMIRYKGVSSVEDLPCRLLSAAFPSLWMIGWRSCMCVCGKAEVWIGRGELGFAWGESMGKWRFGMFTWAIQRDERRVSRPMMRGCVAWVTRYFIKLDFFGAVWLGGRCFLFWRGDGVRLGVRILGSREFDIPGKQKTKGRTNLSKHSRKTGHLSHLHLTTTW